MTGEAAFNLAPWKRFLIACYLGRDRILLVDQWRWGRMAVRNRIYTDETRRRMAVGNRVYTNKTRLRGFFLFESRRDF